LISQSRNFIFVHIRKSAGNSIQSALLPYAEDEQIDTGTRDGQQFQLRHPRYRTLSKHSSLQNYRDAMPSDEFDHYFKFACARNPWTRMMSWWFFFAYGPRNNPATTGRWLWRRPLQPTFKRQEFIKFVEWNWHKAPEGNRCSCLRNLMLDGEVAIDAVIRFEHLQADFDHVCQKIGVPTTPLPHMNQSRNTGYMRHYDSGTLALVAEACRDEIEYFGYSPDEVDAGPSLSATSHTV